MSKREVYDRLKSAISLANKAVAEVGVTIADAYTKTTRSTMSLEGFA